MATTIVAIRSPAYVVVASDSRVSAISSGEVSPTLGCKIQQVGTFFVGAAGYFGDTRGFNAFDLARKASTEGGDLIAIADRFERVTIEPFKGLIQTFRQEHPVDFTRYCDNRDCLEVVFVGIENAVPKLYMRSFRATIRDKEIVIEPADRHDCPGDCVTGAAEALLGIHGNADALIDRTPHFWKVKGIVAGMDEVIGAEIKADPAKVALPISILTIDGSGPHWEPGHQGVCRDIKK
jgi:hypothetical protein